MTVDEKLVHELKAAGITEEDYEDVEELRQKINEIIAFLKKNRAERNDPGYCDIPQPLQ